MDPEKPLTIIIIILIIVILKPTNLYANEIEEVKLAQIKPTFIPSSDWALVLKYCVFHPEAPYLVAGIGWHETHWGRLGAGKGGWHLGFGYYPGSKVKEKYRGLENQLKGACSMISKYFKFPVSQSSCINFATAHYKPSVPTAWGKSVYSIYSALEKDKKPPPTPTEVADAVDKVKKLDLIINFLVAFGDKVKEVWGDE